MPKENLEYRICFDLVENLDLLKNNPNFYGSVEVENKLYAITIDNRAKGKELAEENFHEIFHEHFIAFKTVNAAYLRFKGKPLEYYHYSSEKDNGKERSITETKIYEETTD